MGAFRGAAAALLVALLLCGCHANGASRRAAAIARAGWNVEEQGAWVLITGPAATLRAGAEWLGRSLWSAGLGEPDEAWFRFYTGPMLPLSDVALLCSSERAVHAHTIRALPDGTRFPARYQSWHFPRCIEALPGLYEIEVHYFDRRTEDARDGSSTRHTESVQPSRVAWYAEAGGLYLLRAALGDTGPASAPTPRSRLARRASLGTSRSELEEGQWVAEIERLESWDAVDPELLGDREAWRRYEGS